MTEIVDTVRKRESYFYKRNLELKLCKQHKILKRMDYIAVAI